MRNILKSIKLDHEILKSRYPLFAVAFALGTVLAFVSKLPIYGALIIMLISAPLVGQIFAIYEKNNLENLYGILPLKKSEVVTGRYIYTFFIVLISGSVSAFLAYIVSRLTNKPMSGAEFLTYFSGGFLYYCLMNAVLFPLYFRFSFNKVYIFSNVPFYIIFVILFTLIRKTSVLEHASPTMQSLMSNYSIAWIGFGLGLLLLTLSCILSCALVQKNIQTQIPLGKAGERLHYIDNLRSGIVILVVLQHIALLNNTLYLFMMLNQAYFMGLLFLLSGYFIPGSLEHKGATKFLKDRILRLGIPTLLYVFVLNPIASWAYQMMRASADTAAIRFALGPMWFVVMLFVFDMGYVLWYLINKRWNMRPLRKTHSVLTLSKIALYTLGLAAVSYLFRMYVPYGIPVVQFPSLAYLPQYLSFFLIGVIAYRRDWLHTIPSSFGQIGFVLAILVSIVLLPISLTGKDGSFIGHGSWKSAVFALWDSIFAVGISLALITFFRRFWNKGQEFSRFLSEHSFTVYVIHVPIIAMIILSILSLQLHPLLKFGVATVVGLPLCFAVSWLIRKIPYVSKVL